MNTKTASVRLDTNLYNRIDEHCVSKDCARNDFIKSAIEAALAKDDDVVEHKPYHDTYGNYWTWNKEEKIWTCHLDL